MPIKKLEIDFHSGMAMSGRIFLVFAAAGPKDTTEGRGPRIDRSYHLSETEALIATKGIGVMGGDGEVVPRRAFQFDGRDDYFLLPDTSFTIDTDPQAAAKLREAAIGKLTKAELAALLGPK